MSSHAIEAAPALPERRRNRAWSKFKRNRSAMLGAAIVLTIIVVAILVPFLSSYDPAQVSFTAIRKAPSATH